MVLLIAAATILVVPFAPKGEAPGAVGIAVAESVVDLVVQGKADNFLTLKQLDAVLRRRDLHLADPAVPERSLELAKALGASDVITGEVWLTGGKWLIDARRLDAAGKLVGSARVDGPRSALPGLAQQAGAELLQATPQPLMTASTAALEAVARCEAVLPRQSLGIERTRMTLAGERLAAADKSCREALKHDPRFGLARAGLAVVLIAKGKLGDARKEAQKAQADRFVPLAVLAEAFAARKLNDVSAFRQVLQNGFAERPGFLHALGYLAEDSVDAGDHKVALELFEQYLARSPTSTWAMGRKGHELARLGQWDEAIELSEKALSLNPGDPELLIETASRYIDAGRDPRAEPLLQQAMNAKPPRPLAALRLGYLYFRGHKLPLAREVLEKAVAMATREDESRTRAIAHADLARVAARQNRYADAIGELQKARAEGYNHLPCDEPELARWSSRPELRQVCVEAAAAASDEHGDDDAVPVDL